MDAALYLSLLLGVRHAFEPDHMAAVAHAAAETDVATSVGGRAWRGARIGLWWGSGHAVSLLALIALAATVGFVPSPRMVAAAESLVGLWLIWVGASSMLRALRDGRRGPSANHHHGALGHTHPMIGRHVHLGRQGTAFSLRPLGFGLLHGLAGSGALLAVAAAAQRTTAGQLAFAASFGIGATLAMAVASAVSVIGMARLGGLHRTRLVGGVGLASMLVGVLWIAGTWSA